MVLAVLAMSVMTLTMTSCSKDDEMSLSNIVYANTAPVNIIKSVVNELGQNYGRR